MKTRAAWVILAILVVVPLALLVWALMLPRSSSTVRERPPFDRYRPAWTSAMSKAGVEATFPAAPVPLERLRATGRQSLEATFTAEEVASLLSVYTFESTYAGRTFGISDAALSVSTGGVVDMDARLYTGGSSYPFSLSAPVAYRDGRIISRGLTSLQADGFDVGGNRRKQAGDVLLSHLNLLLDTAPGLDVTEVRFAEDAVWIRGYAPHALQNGRD